MNDDSENSIILNTEAEYEAALARVEVFFDMPEEPDPESADGKEFTALIDAIVAYEAIHYPIDPPVALAECFGLSWETFRA